MGMDEKRVRYFSQRDMMIGYNLQNLEERLRDFDANIFVNGINDVMELYHIKQHIDNGNHLVKWTEEDIKNYESVVKPFPGIIVKFLQGIPKDKLFEEYQNLEWGYESTFWEIVANYNLLDLIDEVFLNRVLEKPNKLRVLLQQKRVVDKFKVFFHTQLLQNPNSAHILLDKFARTGIEFGNDIEYYLPSTLTIEEKEQIIIDFLNQEEPNLNYVRVALHVKDNPEQLVLGPKTRLLAEDVEKRLNDNIVDNATLVQFSYGVEFDSKEGIPPTRTENREDGLMHIHSTRYIEKLDDIGKILVFGNLFGLLGEGCLINLVNKDYETDGLELAFMDRGKDAYFMNQACEYRNHLAVMNTHLYRAILPSLEKWLETLIKSFYEKHFKEDYFYPSLVLTIPSDDSDWMAKCRTIMPELDAVAKQYDLFVEEGDIDPRLYALGKPMLVTDVKSMFTNKYVELKGKPEELLKPMCFLYRTAEVLHVIDGYDTTDIHDFISFITEKDIPYDVYTDDYRKECIDYLIEQGYIHTDDNNMLKPRNIPAIKVLGILWRHRVVSYWHCKKEERAVIEEWLSNGYLKTDDHLLCESERNLYSYYLNNNKYTNGPAIRNMYAHGAIPMGDDVQVHAKNYYILLTLLVLLLLKIEDEFRIGLQIIMETPIGKPAMIPVQE